jgi:transposase-like protein
LVTSEAHQRLKVAIEAVLQGGDGSVAEFILRGPLLPRAQEGSAGGRRATTRTVFAQPEAESAHGQWRRVADGFRERFPSLADLMGEAGEDVLAYAVSPKEHWQKPCSSPPLKA